MSGFSAKTNEHMIRASIATREMYSLDCCVPTVPTECKKEGCTPKPKENKMYMEVDTDGRGRSDLATTRSFLRSRLEEAKEAKREPTKRAYGMADDERPKTANELIERIKSGKFTIDADRGDTKDYNRGLSFINWRDPESKKDEKGYDAAWQKVRDAKKDAELIIMTGDEKEGRAAVKTFEAFTA